MQWNLKLPQVLVIVHHPMHEGRRGGLPGREARLSYMGHAVMENRHGLAVAGTVNQGDGTAERRAAEALLKHKARRRGRRITVGEDRPMTAAIT